MTNYSKPNYIQYEDWFITNIDPMDFEYDKEKRFSNYVHESFIECQTII